MPAAESAWCNPAVVVSAGLVFPNIEPLWFGLLTKPRPPNSISPWVHQYGTGATTGGGALTGNVVTIAADGGGGFGGHCAEVALPSVQKLAPVASPPWQHPN